MTKEAKRSKVRRAFDKIINYSPSYTEFVRNGSKSLLLYKENIQATVTPFWGVVTPEGPECLSFEMKVEEISSEDVCCLVWSSNALSLEFVIHKVNETFARVIA